jgi:hypothetical protein
VRAQLSPLLLGDRVDLRTDFNELEAVARLLILVSPTCPMCLHGARAVAEVLDRDRELEVAVFAVWMMGEPSDSCAEAERQRQLLVDERARHYWDGTDEVGGELGRLLGQPGLVAWDTYAGYAAGVRWDHSMPPPTDHVHQMGDPPWSHDDFYCSDPRELPWRLVSLLQTLSEAAA